MAQTTITASLALKRFGLGPRPGDLATVGKDVRDLFRSEIQAGPQISPVPSHGGTVRIGENLQRFREAQQLSRALKATPSNLLQAELPGGGIQPPLSFPPAAQYPGQVVREETLTRIAHLTQPLGGLPARLTQFWSNHFCVAIAKGQTVRVMAGAMERECIAPHVLGRFETMLQAVESHPAMLVYLDNQQSIGPNSRAGKRRGRGLNENLAREILELHTLGVNGGYTQDDVTALARIITGWGVVPTSSSDGLPSTFRFNPNLHEPGDHRVLGRTYRAGGIEQGRAVLADIARHPATARHIAFKLARHFVADVPPPALVARLARVFRDSDGDLKAVTLALIDAPEAWAVDATGPGKIRTPQEFQVALVRGLSLKLGPGQLAQPLRAMGQELWNPPGPNGFPDTADAWAQPEGLKSRLDVALGAARLAGGLDPRKFIAQVLGPDTSQATIRAVSRAESRAQGLALALMSPEFQRR